MARKTSFYYSFLVLPAEQRRAIVAVWDFCRAVDDAVDEEASVGEGRPTGRAAVPFWRAELARCYDGAEPGTTEGRRLQPFIRRLEPAAPGVRGRDRRRGDGPGSFALPDVRRPVRVLPPRRVGRRDDLHPRLRLPRSARGRLRAEPRRRPAAHEHPARRQGRSRPRPRVPAARGSRGVRVHRGRPRGRPGDRAGAAPARVRVRPRARLLRARRGRPSRRAIAGGSSPPRSCAPSISRRSAASSAAATTSSARARACRSRGRPGSRSGSGSGTRERPFTLVGRDRRRRRLRRAERRRAAGRRTAPACSCSRRARGWAGARPRSPTARPASSSTTASTCCSAPTPRRSRSSRDIGALDNVRMQPQLARHDDRPRRPVVAACVSGPAGAAPPASPASSNGTRSAGAIALAVLGMAAPLRLARRALRSRAHARSRRRRTRRWRTG